MDEVCNSWMEFIIIMKYHFCFDDIQLINSFVPTLEKNPFSKTFIKLYHIWINS